MTDFNLPGLNHVNPFGLTVKTMIIINIISSIHE